MKKIPLYIQLQDSETRANIGEQVLIGQVDPDIWYASPEPPDEIFTILSWWDDNDPSGQSDFALIMKLI